MSFWSEWKRKFARRPGFDQGLDEEIRFHLETRAEELESQGMSRVDAMHKAYREFGSTQRTREDSRAAWQFLWMEELLSDVRYALRALRRNPGFAATGIVSLALGIGANTTFFSLTTGFLFSKPSVRDADSLVALRLGGNSHSPLSAFRFVRDSGAFAGLAGEREEAEVNWRDGDRSSRLQVMRVTDNFFDVIGVPLAFGRGIPKGEPRATVISYNFWRDHLGSDRNVLSRKLTLDGSVYTIVGVLPRNSRTLIGFGFAPDLYVPVEGEDSIVAFYARLPAGMTRRAALDRFTMVARNLDRVQPMGGGFKWESNLQISAVSGFEWLNMMGVLPVAAFFGVLMIVIGLVLLVACANVASLLLARASSRSQELAIRLSIGASRSRIVRHLLAESLLLGVLGTVAGLLLNLWLMSVFNLVEWPVPIPIRLQIEPDFRLLAYSSALAILSALVSGLLPSLKASRTDVNRVLKQSEHQVSGRRWTLRNVLVAGQLAVSILLLTTGLLFLRNLLKSIDMSPGFDVQETAVAHVRLVPEKYATNEQSERLIEAALDGLRAIPGVESASTATVVPLNGHHLLGTSLKTDLNKEKVYNQFSTNEVSPQYFQTMGIPILQGRDFTDRDSADSARVVILNEAAAHFLFGSVSPVGHWIQWNDGPPSSVVGVARNAKYFLLSDNNKCAMYWPMAQKTGAPVTELSFLIRARARPDGLAKPVTRFLSGLDSSAAVEFKPMRDALGFALLPSRLGAVLLGSMGFLGLTLAAVGLYGVLVYSIARRTREIGLRVAFGASRVDVLRLVFRESFLLAGSGAVIGVSTALLVTRPLKAFLVSDLSASDPLSYAMVLAALAVVVFAATLAPAVRALRVDPLRAIHYE
jgi:predicted permease